MNVDIRETRGEGPDDDYVMSVHGAPALDDGDPLLAGSDEQESLVDYGGVNLLETVGDFREIYVVYGTIALEGLEFEALDEWDLPDPEIVCSPATNLIVVSAQRQSGPILVRVVAGSAPDSEVVAGQVVAMITEPLTLTTPTIVYEPDVLFTPTRPGRHLVQVVRQAPQEDPGADREDRDERYTFFISAQG